ncbi:MAG: hypothetical protein E7311_05620 [Clostridiales bacterium]|nr:hypothetical protein [Clostridiales bacterium]
MGIINIIRTVKELHKKDVVMVRGGKFIYVYGKDAVIISYMYNYQIKKIEGNVNSCGFPETALNKVISRLEDKCINYRVIDRSNEYNVEIEEDYKNKNKYDEIYNVANKYITKRNKVNEIYGYLMENLTNDEINGKIVEIEKIVYEI